jgi:hypothetical protein
LNLADFFGVSASGKGRLSFVGRLVIVGGGIIIYDGALIRSEFLCIADWPFYAGGFVFRIDFTGVTGALTWITGLNSSLEVR